MNNSTTNGRIDLYNEQTNCNVFQLYDKIPNKQTTSYVNATEGLWNETLLSKVYFSKENIQIIQNAIRKGVFIESNHQFIIEEQSGDDLKTIMRSIFLQYSKNQECNIQGQIMVLNNMVIEYCVKNVYSEALGYMQYIKDASTLVVPMAHPTYSKENNRQLELKKWF